MSQSDYYHLDVDKILKETESAFLFKIGDEQMWFPKSQIADPGDYSVDDENCTMSVTVWIATQRGFEI